MSKEKYGFVYLWFDRKHKRFYVGCHWGSVDDGYTCSSSWMKKAMKLRPEDFKRRVLKTNITYRPDMYLEEQRLFDMIKPHEIKPINPHPRYYNLCLKVGNLWHKYPEKIKTIGAKISAAKTGHSPKWKDPESRGAKISASKKAKFAERHTATGSKFSDETRQRMSAAKLGTKHTEEWKVASSARLKAQWSDGTRSKDEISSRMKIAWVKRKDK